MRNKLNLAPRDLIMLSKERTNLLFNGSRFIASFVPKLWRLSKTSPFRAVDLNHHPILNDDGDGAVPQTAQRVADMFQSGVDRRFLFDRRRIVSRM